MEKTTQINLEALEIKIALENVKRGKVRPIEQVAGELGINLKAI